jgi:hypothetical protein
MAEISDEELAQLRAKAAQADAPRPAEDAPKRERLVPHRALLADGTVHEYAGAHPTHVAKRDTDGREQLVPVLSVYRA